MVTNGIKLLLTSLANSVKAVLGDMYAKKEINQLNSTFSRFEPDSFSGRRKAGTGRAYVHGAEKGKEKSAAFI